MPRITIIVAAALATLALAAPVATAMPQRDAVGTSTSAQQDLRGADARDAGAQSAEPVPGLPTWPVNPEPIAPAPVETTPIAGGDDTSPLLYVLPGIALSLLLAAGLGYAVRTSRRARISV